MLALRQRLSAAIWSEDDGPGFVVAILVAMLKERREGTNVSSGTTARFEGRYQMPGLSRAALGDPAYMCSVSLPVRKLAHHFSA